MQPQGDEFLADAALAEDQHRAGHVGQPAHLLPQLHHDGARTDQFVARRRGSLAQSGVVGLEGASPAQHVQGTVGHRPDVACRILDKISHRAKLIGGGGRGHQARERA